MIISSQFIFVLFIFGSSWSMANIWMNEPCSWITSGSRKLLFHNNLLQPHHTLNSHHQFLCEIWNTLKHPVVHSLSRLQVQVPLCQVMMVSFQPSPDLHFHLVLHDGNQQQLPKAPPSATLCGYINTSHWLYETWGGGGVLIGVCRKVIVSIEKWRNLSKTLKCELKHT